jgi:transcriptional regulator with XRE-family HTH domain
MTGSARSSQLCFRAPKKTGARKRLAHWVRARGRAHLVRTTRENPDWMGRGALITIIQRSSICVRKTSRRAGWSGTPSRPCHRGVAGGTVPAGHLVLAQKTAVAHRPAKALCLTYLNWLQCSRLALGPVRLYACTRTRGTGMPPKTVGETIQEARTARFKLREFARLLDISATHLSDVENNRRVPSEELLSQIAQHLGLDLDRLMAAAGRVPEETRRFMEKHPEVFSLFRKVSSLQPEELKKLEKTADSLARRRGQDK